MKVLLLAVFLGIAAAGPIQDSKHAIYEAVVASQGGMEDAAGLWKAADLHNSASQLNVVERDMKTELGKALKDTLDKIVNGIKTRVDKVKGIVGKVTDQVNELKEKLRKLAEEGKEKTQEAIDLMKKGVHNIVDTIVDSIQKKKDNFDDQMDEVSKLKMKDLIKQLKERILQKVQGIREYLKDIAVDNEAVRQLKALLKEIDNEELSNLLKNIMDLSGHEYRHLQDLFQRLKEIGAKSKGVLKDKIMDLTGWVQTLWHEGMDELVEKFQKVRSTLLEVIANAKDFSVGAVKDALNHLKTYETELGDLYGKLVDSLKKAIGKF